MHEFTKYFKNDSGFERLIYLTYQKYKSLSSFSGTIKISNLTEKESLSLSRFFGKTYNHGEDAVIPIKNIINVMKNSKYQDFNITTLIEEYFNITLITKKEEIALAQEKKHQFFKEIINNSNGLAKKWLESVIENKNEVYKLLEQRYNKNKHNLKNELINITTMLNNLPEKKTLISVFAATYTNNPHYLDLDNYHLTIFLYALAYISKTNYPKSRIDKIKLLANYNIEIDNLSNFVITYNLLSNKNYINKFADNKESLILNLQNILTTDFFDSKNKKVYIFENPSILTEILARNIDTCVIISSGFPNICVYLLLDKLIENNNHLYYNGDFDPEGLVIAQKLKEKYGTNLELICYDEVDYHNCSFNENLSDARVKKLNAITNDELSIIKRLIIFHKYAAYQENNIERIISFIKNS